MSKSDVATIVVRLDTEKLEISTAAISKALKGLNEVTDNLANQIQESFISIINNVGLLSTGVQELSKSFKTIEGWDFSNVLTELTQISDTLDEIFEKVSQPDWVGIAALVLQGLDFIGGKGGKVIGGYSGKYESGKTTLGGSKGKYTSNQKTEQIGILASGAMNASGVGTLDGSLAGEISNLIALLTSSTAAWTKNTAAKIADKAEDLAIISLYAVDYVKAFGSMIAKMATSTAAWIANTAAKVGNTAAQWAQIAAVTAWQAICTAATAVTTAFGAAMTFLASPIGLVVVGITALIAIIALLIANWDTVSAKLQQGFHFIQSVLQGFNNFLQGVFATDFTEQFGAVGNVLNAFFAYFENLWNAVKSIFSGVISFVKNVFAGDWIGIWNSLVSVFIGIWNGMAARFKAPINGIIGLLNTLLQRIVDKVNVVIGSLNVIASVIPGMGGKTLFKPWVAPKIPYLARGAVLPANRPFLAVLGDQRHGNNIEAPEGLIRDIFKEEMGDFLGGVMAGFEALLEENRTLRTVVECIEVGDTTIGQAANRYNDKMAVVRGRA